MCIANERPALSFLDQIKAKSNKNVENQLSQPGKIEQPPKTMAFLEQIKARAALKTESVGDINNQEESVAFINQMKTRKNPFLVSPTEDSYNSGKPTLSFLDQIKARGSKSQQEESVDDVTEGSKLNVTLAKVDECGEDQVVRRPINPLLATVGSGAGGMSFLDQIKARRKDD